jgi:hypothetical protein
MLYSGLATSDCCFTQHGPFAKMYELVPGFDRMKSTQESGAYRRTAWTATEPYSGGICGWTVPGLEKPEVPAMCQLLLQDIFSKCKDIPNSASSSEFSTERQTDCASSLR